ncbi:acetyl-CoA carboxylase biotin carboxyl carrier protein [Rivularia sp. UHCC 0363]|uniref:acetyl-CoA carboxylase biotin carboxyl carrier protein n=1 Tax=Rivularia sp. UHCC 0363 TaxID=3110244 RepID=UPI002B21FBF6|nr:acetyl-CoA carboxylase biotin carboxyl carrier protein [Rivularia sp. UHCC 0363]MEA5593160.1 acetyl-CoA carboxylase biotin carboxyl carrier protein [Rivularia sp. UHCC 0363]
MSLDFNEIRQLLATIAQTDISEVNIKSENFELTVRRGVSYPHQIASEAVAVPSVPISIPAPEVSLTVENPSRSSSDSGNGGQSNATSTAKDSKLIEIYSPMVGTFYRAPAPGEATFVEVGDRIRRGDTVCIIEAMKLMNEIEAELSGKVMEILVENGSPVEYGQALMRINPD